MRWRTREERELRSKRAERGTALLTVLMAVLLMSALGLVLTLGSIADVLAAGNVRAARAMLYAADAGIERSLIDLQRAPDWDDVLSGALTSGFTDGPPSGERTLEDGRTIRLEEIANLANCGGSSFCDDAAMNASSEERPWGSNNARWRLFGWGPMASLSASIRTSGYLVVLVADDPLDGDDNPLRDGRGATPGRGVLLVRAHAFGLGGAGRVIEATVARDGTTTDDGGYTAQRGRPVVGGPPAAPVQVPNAGLGRVEMSLSEGGLVR